MDSLFIMNILLLLIGGKVLEYVVCTKKYGAVLALLKILYII